MAIAFVARDRRARVIRAIEASPGQCGLPASAEGQSDPGGQTRARREQVSGAAEAPDLAHAQGERSAAERGQCDRPLRASSNDHWGFGDLRVDGGLWVALARMEIGLLRRARSGAWRT